MYLTFTSTDQVLTDLRAAGAPDSHWLICAADSHGDQLPALIEACRNSGIRICGGLFPGLIHGAKTFDSGLIAIALPPQSQVLIAELGENGASWRSPPPVLGANEQFSSTILVDCLAPNISALLEDIYDRYGNQIFHVGAGTGYHDLRPGPTIFTEQGLLPNAGLLILTPHRATVRVRHGWQRLRGPFVASRTKGNVIQELNWAPAGSVYRKQVIDHDPALHDRPIFPDLNSRFPLCISKEGGEDVMRDPVRLTDADEIVVLSDVAENSVMYLAHGSRDTLIAAARQAMEDCGAPDDVESCFLSDCYSRALMLGEDFPLELSAAGAVLARFTDVVPEGVLALGEIAANGRQGLEFFNKTFVVALRHR